MRSPKLAHVATVKGHKRLGDALDQKKIVSTHVSSHMPSIFSVDGFGLNNRYNLWGRTTVHSCDLAAAVRSC